MADTLTSVRTEEKAHRLAERFDAYSLGLVFSILALSVQSAEFGAHVGADTAELLAWCLLLISGIAGLWRAEYTAQVQQQLARTQQRQEQLHQVKVELYRGNSAIMDPDSGTTKSMFLYRDELEDEISNLRPTIEALARSQSGKYRVMKWTFLVAVIALLTSRAWMPVMELRAQLW